MSLLLIASIIALLPITAAVANYIAPFDAEKFVVLADKWQIEKPLLALAWQLGVNYRGNNCKFDIDTFRLADRLDSNSICAGNYTNSMEKYLSELNSRNPRPSILVELVSGKKGEHLCVAGIWAFDAASNFDKAIQQGSHVLNMSAEQVRKLGSKEGYRAKITEMSERNWQQLSGRH